MNQKREEQVRLRERINETCRKADININDLEEIMMLIREIYSLDMIFFTTNKGYKYYFMHEKAVGDHQEINKTSHIALTREEYRKLVETYEENPITDKPLDSMKEEFQGAILHCGIICNHEYFGSVVFWTKHSRIWSDEEKQTLIGFKQLVLIYKGIQQLSYGITPYQIAKQEMAEDNILGGFYINLKTDRCHVIKIPAFLKDTVNEWEDYTGLLNRYAEKYTDPAYGKLLIKDFSPEQIRRSMSVANPILYMEYPRKTAGEICWALLRMEMIEAEADGSPQHIIAIFKDITQEIQDRAFLAQQANRDRKTYSVISSLDLDSERYDVYVDNRDAAAVSAEHADYEGYGLFSNLIRDISQYNIVPEYAERFARRFSIETMRQHFDSSSRPIIFEFPFVINEEEFWVRLEASRSERYGIKDHKVLLYFSDITKQKNREIQMEKKKAILEKENEEKKFQLEHDPLTGVYNRLGYNSILEKYKQDDRPVAYIQIDVDNFKIVNDTYGHAFGDAVLKQVAAQLTETFRADDPVFRFGGDEFAVLLTNCHADVWNSIGQKQRMMHIRMNQHLHKKIYVSLSMGISWSPSGFHSEMIALADEALYHTKNNGRAGCSVINDKHDIIFEWNDEIGMAAESNPLAQSGTGAYRLEYPNGDVDHGRLFCNETSRVLLGLTESMTPEECYGEYLKRLDPLYRNTTIKMRGEMIECGQAECTYGYNHPTQGHIMIRSGGKAVRNSEGIVLYGYHQSLQDTRIVLKEDDTRKLIAGMNSLYFCSYYISLQEDNFYTFKATLESGELERQEERASLAIKNFVDVLVNQSNKEEMLKFVDLSTLQERMGEKPFIEQEYLSVTDKGWCRARFIPIDREDSGNLTHVLFVIGSIDKAKRARIEHDRWVRDAMRMQIRIGEIVSKSTILQSGLMDKKTGEVCVWNHMDLLGESNTCSFEAVKKHGISLLRKEEHPRFEKEFDLDAIRGNIEENGSYLIAYRVKNDDKYPATTAIHFEECPVDHEKYLVVCEGIDVSVEHLQGLLSSEYKLMTCVQNLINLPEADDALEYLLDQIIRYYDCDRACLSILTGEHQGTLVTERCHEGMSRKFTDGDVLPLTGFLQWESVRSPIRLQKVYCDGDESDEQRWMKDVGLDNLMILSFEYGEGKIGYISIDNLKQHIDDSNWIGTLAFFIAKEMQKL